MKKKIDKQPKFKQKLQRHALWLTILTACSVAVPVQAQQNDAVADINSLEGDSDDGLSFDMGNDSDFETDDLGDMTQLENDPPSKNKVSAGQPIADDMDVGINNGIQCATGKVCIESSTGLPLQVLPRSFTNIYQSQSADNNNIMIADVAAFQPLYVFARDGIDLSNPADPKGWYQVGQNDKQAKGWMQAKDVLEWKQALIVAYTHPGDEIEGRKPVLMFKDLPAITQVIESNNVATEADKIYQQIDDNITPQSIVSIEPKRYININDQLYFLPILNWKSEEIEAEDVRLLQIAAAVPNARGADTITTTGYMENAGAGRTDIAGANIEDMNVDMVFVIDTTRSMQPYIDATRDMVNNIAKKISGDYQGDIKFGVVGYRDSKKVTPKIEYTAENFTPTLVDASQLAGLLSNKVKATRVGSRDYVEEVFAGVELGLQKSNWRENSIRLIVLIGDASSHPVGHEKNTIGKDEVALLRELKEGKVHMLAVHIANPKAAKDHDRAKEQFGTLASIAGSDEQALLEANTANPASFEKVVDEIVDQITERFKHRDKKQSNDKGKGSSSSKTRDIVDKVWDSALIEYIGQSATPPKDITAWVSDKDLTNIEDQSLEVRVLITKEQLSNLLTALDRILSALKESNLSQGQFFDALQNISGQTLKRPDDIAQAQKLSETGLLPAFINSLPYKSDVLSLTNDMFASMTTEQRTKLEQDLHVKLNQYTDLNENTGAWHRLNKDDPDSVLVHPLLIEYLP